MLLNNVIKSICGLTFKPTEIKQGNGQAYHKFLLIPRKNNFWIRYIFTSTYGDKSNMSHGISYSQNGVQFL